MSTNNFAEAIIYDFLTDPQIEKRVEFLESIPKRCLNCNKPGLRPLNSKPWTEEWPYQGTVTLKRYACPFCNRKFIFYESNVGCGIINNRSRRCQH